MAQGEGNTRWERDSLSRALDRLVVAGTLTADQADAVRREVAAQQARPAQPPPPASGSFPWTAVLAEIGAYVGGAFVAGAAAVLVNDTWGQLPTAARVAVLDVPAAALILAAVLVARSAGPGRRPWAGLDDGGARGRMISVFVAVAAVLLGYGSAVVAEAAGADDETAVLAGFWTAFAVAGIGYALCRGALLHVGTGIALTGAVLATLSSIDAWDEDSTGWALVAVAAVWALGCAAGVLRERGFGYALAGGLAFIGGETLIGWDSAPGGYTVLVVLAVAGLAGFVVTRVMTLLVTGVGTLAVVVPQGVIDATDGALGAAGGLLVVGLSIVGASVLGMRLRKASPLP